VFWRLPLESIVTSEISERKYGSWVKRIAELWCH